MSDWSCSNCTWSNQATQTKCASCGNTAPFSAPTAATTTPSYNTTSSYSNSQYSSAQVTTTTTAISSSSSGWKCSKCSWENQKTDAKCMSCGTNGPGSTTIASATTIPYKPVYTQQPTSSMMTSMPYSSTPTNNNGIASAPPAKPDEWICCTCQWTNNVKDKTCQACSATSPPGTNHPASAPNAYTNTLTPTAQPSVYHDAFAEAPYSPTPSADSNTWPCSACTFNNQIGSTACNMCGSAKPGTSAQPQYLQGANTSIRVGIPNGMKPGERLNVPTSSGQQATVTIPDRSKWIYVSTGQATFDATIPAAATTSASNSVSGSDTSAAPTHSALASGLNKNTNYAPPANAEEWVRYENVSGGQYQAPHLGMVPVRVPPTPTVIRPSGRRRALLIGINYKGTRAALRGCVNDAENMKRLLMKHGFPNDGSHMVVLTDDSSSKRNYLPTGANIFRAIKWLLQGVAEGDVLFFHFSGHGAQVPDQTGHEADGLNETILPLDFQNKQITDDELWGSLVRPLPNGVRLTALMDCCHSGTGLDLPYEYKISSKTTKNRWGSSSKPSTNSQWIEEINPAHSQGDVVLFSGCEDNQTSADVQTSNSAAGGAMTQSFVAAYNENPMATYPEFMKAIHKSLKRRNFSQRPQLTSSQPFNASERVFSLVDGIEPNRNQEIGRMKTRHVRAGKVKKGHSMGDIMGIGAAMAGGLLLGELLF